MAAPTQPLTQTMTVTVANPTPPTNVPVNYQGTPPTPVGLAPTQAADPDVGAQMWLFADPLNGAVATQWTGTDAKTVTTELAGKAEDEGTEVTTTIGSVISHGAGTSSFIESPNTEHPSFLDVAPLGPELVTGGDFAAATGWTLSGGASISASMLQMSGAGTGLAVSTAAGTLTAGNYQFQFSIVSRSGTNPIIVSVGGTSYTVTGSTTPGIYSGVITTTASAQTVSLSCATNVCQLDNFSVKRLL